MPLNTMPRAIDKKTSKVLPFTRMKVQDICEDLQDPGPVPETGDNALI